MSFDTLDNSLGLSDGLGNKWYKGKVVTNVDPLNLDRIQVQIPNLYDPNLGPLPWIGKTKQSPFGQGDGFGVFGTPAVGADVAILLQDGDPHYPLYSADLQCFANPGEFPSGTAWGFKDPDGNKLVVQGKDVKFETGGGFQLHIDENGSYTVTVPADQTGTYNVPHLVYNVTDFTINASGDVDVNGANFNVVASSAATITAPTTTVEGALNVTGLATFDMLAAFSLGVAITGPSTSNGHDISDLHRHFNESGSFTGVVST